ncbi:LacI family DNA-binding transcriptional regulator [Auraticoccus monumenti]|uniref:DNA-binding transcriptional regulator, LacI/PurR family n=1 Tax=Auraticoccus monumenti TaxID=675864 RepID=A0A1G6THH8_9ACTN|nr:LacI family DNA-binding transcriptional regulator [Auraticoccus monumenti]SDD27785.1 DNA-binding transcriptional regulator, LacI/PurR family [Auraticoccus monumenti]
MAVGMKDVAQRAGVSIKTVSNVVNGYPHITPATKAKVTAAIAELGYRPNLFGRSLRTGRTGVIALAVPAIDNTYYAALARAVIREAEALRWTVLVDQTEASPERERLVLDGIRDRMIDGLLFAPRSVSAATLADRPAEVPLVLLGDRVVDPGLDRVTVDSVAVGRAATEHLLGLGRTRVAALGVSPEDTMAMARLSGVRQAQEAAGLHPDQRLELPVEHWDHDSGHLAVDRLLATGADFDALVCFNDALALGAVHALQQAGRSIPGEVAVIGVDDVPASRFLWPPLSSVRLDKELIAHSAVTLLAERIAHPDAPVQHVTAGFEVVPRASTLG